MEFSNLINTYLNQHFASSIDTFKQNASPYLDIALCREVAYVFGLTIEEAMDYFCEWCENNGNDYQLILSN